MNHRKQSIHTLPISVLGLLMLIYSYNTTFFLSQQNKLYVTDSSNTTAINNNINEKKWIPLSPEEKAHYINQDMSSSKFQHCHYGQSRRIDRVCDIDNVLWKWNENRTGANRLANITNVLDYMEERKKDKDESCNIIIAGASLSHDTYMGAYCQLEQAGYVATSCITGGEPIYGDDAYVTCDSRDLYISHFFLENPHATSCPKIALVFNHPEQTKYMARLEKLAEDENFKNGFVMMYNWGVHCNDKETPCLRPMLEETFIPLLTNPKFDHWTILFREHEPQHFSTPGGLFIKGQGWRCSRATVKADNWRNEEVVQILKDHNLTSKVPIIPLFDALEPLTSMHVVGDCTHYCYNPFRFEVTWDGLLNALKQYDGVPYHYNAIQ